MDKQIRNLIIIAMIVLILMVLSTYVLRKPQVFGSPGEEVIVQNNAYFVLVISTLTVLFVFLITMIVGRYALLRAREKDKKENTKI
tara:strand:+ start:539 stop:796 length:258 start_codon:yes stop_codon:yes gene_type:complete